MKDVQKVQPSESQVYSGITSFLWIVEPLWGLLTDAAPIWGIAAGLISCLRLKYTKSFNFF